MTVGIILAAGSGRRLRIHKPKGMLNIGGRPLIEYSIDNLVAAGIYKVIVVTGFASECYDRYFEEHYRGSANVKLVHNPEWESCGSLYSLYIGLREVKGGEDTVILDSDILYNRDEFLDFMQRPEANAILATNVPEGRHDACYIQTDLGDHLVKVSKNSRYIPGSDRDPWEYIGITQSGSDTVRKILRYSKEKFEETGSIDHEYDYAFESIGVPYKVVRYRDYIWSEADDNEQLHHMITNTYPKISIY